MIYPLDIYLERGTFKREMWWGGATKFPHKDVQETPVQAQLFSNNIDEPVWKT